MTMSFQTRGDEEHRRLFCFWLCILYRLLRAVYISTGVEWPGDEATAEADAKGKQQKCVLFTHHSG